MVQDCVEEQAAAGQTGEPMLSKEPSSDQENTICGNVEQVMLPVRGYATRSAVAAALAAQQAAKASGGGVQTSQGEKKPSPAVAEHDGKAPPAAPRRRSACTDTARQSIEDGGGSPGAAAWDALCAELLSASEVLAVSRVIRTEAAAE